MFYQWIYNYDQSLWMVARFAADGDSFTLCGNRRTYRIVSRNLPNATVEYVALDQFKGRRVLQANITFGEIVRLPNYTPNF